MIQENNWYAVRDDYHYFGGIHGLWKQTSPPQNPLPWETQKRYEQKKLDLYERIIQLCNPPNREVYLPAAYLDYVTKKLAVHAKTKVHPNMIASPKLFDTFTQEKDIAETDCKWRLRSATAAFLLKRGLGYAGTKTEPEIEISQQNKSEENFALLQLKNDGCDPVALYGIFVVINNRKPNKKEQPDLQRHAIKHYSRFPEIYKEFFTTDKLFQTAGKNYAEQIIADLETGVKTSWKQDATNHNYENY
jgi:hypothetical protein